MKRPGAALFLCLVLFAVPSQLRGEDAPFPPELHQVTVGEITAHFGGERDTLGSDSSDLPLQYFVTRLWFTFAGDARLYAFHPQEELDFSDWQFDIFAPDGRHVLLQQSPVGPYHIVRADRLKGYLLGAVGPDAVASGHLADGRARIVDGARWTSPNSIEFTATCCGEPEKIEFRLPEHQSALPPNPRAAEG